MAHSSLQVLTPEYFSRFDTLTQDASNLEESTAALRIAKNERDNKRKELQKEQEELRRLRSFIKEQKYRIQLVSTHWFYGTTLLQVRTYLWLYVVRYSRNPPLSYTHTFLYIVSHNYGFEVVVTERYKGRKTS
jgi:hypothetical protein